jgi:hypothetical protein
MAIDTSNPTSRRALLAGLAGGLAATVANSLGRPQPASAHDADDVRLGGFNSTASLTSITNTSINAATFQGTATGSGAGIIGQSDSGRGVKGASPAGTGVRGESFSGWGVDGFSQQGQGVVGASGGPGSGVSGSSPSGTGVDGESTTGSGVFGHSSSGNGVRAESGGIGVYGKGGAGQPSIYGHKSVASGNAVWGAITNANSSDPAMLAETAGSGDGVRGLSALGRGGRFAGKKAQIRLDPSTATTHPGSGLKGDLFVDASPRLWFCKGGTIWVLLA